MWRPLCNRYSLQLCLQSQQISECAMSRLKLVTLVFSVECCCDIGISRKWCDILLCDVTFLHLMWLNWVPPRLEPTTEGWPCIRSLTTWFCGLTTHRNQERPCGPGWIWNKTLPVWSSVYGAWQRFIQVVWRLYIIYIYIHTLQFVDL